MKFYVFIYSLGIIRAGKKMAEANTNDQAYISADFGLTKSQQYGEHVVIKFEYYFAFLTAIDFWIYCC